MSTMVAKNITDVFRTYVWFELFTTWISENSGTREPGIASPSPSVQTVTIRVACENEGINDSNVRTRLA
jgi:hypothetical protein